MPVFTAENKQDFYGILNSSIDITVNVFSNPKYSEMVIQNKNGIRVTADGMNVKILEEHTFINDIVYKSNVKVKGYKITMQIPNLKVNQIQKYTFLIKNEFGQRYYNISVYLGSKFHGKKSSVYSTCSIVHFIKFHITIYNKLKVQLSSDIDFLKYN